MLSSSDPKYRNHPNDSYALSLRSGFTRKLNKDAKWTHLDFLTSGSSCSEPQQESFQHRCDFSAVKKSSNLAVLKSDISWA